MTRNQLLAYGAMWLVVVVAVSVVVGAIAARFVWAGEGKKREGDE